MLAKIKHNSPELKAISVLTSWKYFLKGWNSRKYVITIKYPHKKKLQRLITPLELHFLCPNKESDSIFIIMTSTLIVKWHHNHRNDTSATSILCQKDVNRRIFLCDRIEIRIREVIFDESVQKNIISHKCLQNIQAQNFCDNTMNIHQIFWDYEIICVHLRSFELIYSNPTNYRTQ